MSLWLDNRNRATVWKIEKRERYAQVRLSTGSKKKDSDEYENSTWSFVRFVGKAFDKIDDLKVRDRIVLKSALFSWSPYIDKESGEKKWATAPSLVVFDWEHYKPDSEPSMDTPPQMDEPTESNEEETPW